MNGRFIIYALHHDDSKRMYVGQSSCGLVRPTRHGWNYNLTHRCPATLASWIKKYKERGGYKIVVLEECSSREELNETEQFHIAYLRSIGVPLLNMNDGGAGNRGRHIVLSDASRERIRVAMKKFAATPEGLAHMAKMTARNMEMTPEQRKAKGLKIAATRTGKTVSEVTKEKLRRANEGKKSPRKADWINPLLGRKRPPHISKMLSERVCTEETRAKHSARMLGSKMSPESIAKMAATKRGKKKSPEAIENHAKTLRGKRQSPEAVEKRMAAVRLSFARRTFTRVLYRHATGAL